MIDLPQAFSSRMKNLLGDEYTDYLKALEEPPVKAFRVNTRKISLEAFEGIDEFSNGKIPYVENGFYLDYEKIGNHPYHHAGMLYVQEPAAMAPAECVEINPEWCVLDMCAAPGGKSTQLKNKLGDKGVLVSNEIISSRCKILTGNIERMGLKNTVTTCMDTKKLARAFPNTFDLIMCDAPCSGEGMFRKEEVAVSEWSEENVRMCAERQAEILENAVRLLKNDGYIIYATCTFSLEENEMMVDSFLQKHPEFELVKPCERVVENTADGIAFEGCECENIQYTRRCYPHKTKGEGQFMAVLHNTLAYADMRKKAEKKPSRIDSIVFDFLNDTLGCYEKDNVQIYNGNPVYFTPDFPVQDGTAFSCGITIGEIKKNYILPHHQFFMGLGDSFKRKIALSVGDDRLAKYLHGEEINVDCANGWAVVMVDGCSLGGAKVVNGVAKNHYPKGLRSKI